MSIETKENKTFVECTLGGDGYRAPAVLLSDRPYREACMVSAVGGLGFRFQGLSSLRMLHDGREISPKPSTLFSYFGDPRFFFCPVFMQPAMRNHGT